MCIIIILSRYIEVLLVHYSVIYSSHLRSGFSSYSSEILIVAVAQSIQKQFLTGGHLGCCSK